MERSFNWYVLANIKLDFLKKSDSISKEKEVVVLIFERKFRWYIGPPKFTVVQPKVVYLKL